MDFVSRVIIDCFRLSCDASYSRCLEGNDPSDLTLLALATGINSSGSLALDCMDDSLPLLRVFSFCDHTARLQLLQCSQS